MTTAVNEPAAGDQAVTIALPDGSRRTFARGVTGHEVAAAIGPGLARAAVNTLVVAGSAALLTVGAALVLVQGVRLGSRRLARLLPPVTALGYAAPGAVLAVGILIPLAALDHWMADGVLALTGWDPGLLLTGTAATHDLHRYFDLGKGDLPPQIHIPSHPPGHS